MIPWHLVYAAWRMKSAESSAGLAPEMWTMQFGALSMIAGTADPLLDSAGFVGGHAAAVLALGPGHARVDEREHDQEAGQEGEHLSHPRSLSGAREVAVGQRRQLARQQDVGGDQGAVGFDDLLRRAGVL